jgi:flagellar basal-body rod modification protein FlgD
MSTVPTVSSGSATTASRGFEDTAVRLPQKALGQNDFLKLLATQFQAQDPMKPMEDTAFIAQMAQFSALEQSSSLARDITLLRTDQQRVTANSYLGHRVTVSDGDQTTTSDVTAVDSSGKEPRLVVGGKTFSLSAVLRVEPSLVTAPAPQPFPAGGA